jgi:hypothetical protein
MFYKVFLSCIFPSLANDILIIGSTSTIHLAFDHFVSQLALMGLMMQPSKCLTWSPFNPLDFSPPIGFCYPSNNIKILGISFGSTSFFNGISLNEDVCHVEAFPRLRDIISSPLFTQPPSRSSRVLWA